MAEAKFTLINLDGAGTFEFQFFPSRTSTLARANWNPQNTTIGVQPLFYSNREPKKFNFDELYFDSTDTNESLQPQIDKLLQLMEETAKGMPPALLAVWGSQRRERCVIEEIEVVEMMFNEAGDPIRVRISMTLVQLQSMGTATSVQILDSEDSGTLGGGSQ